MHSYTTLLPLLFGSGIVHAQSTNVWNWCPFEIHVWLFEPKIAYSGVIKSNELISYPRSTLGIKLGYHTPHFNDNSPSVIFDNFIRDGTPTYGLANFFKAPLEAPFKSHTITVGTGRGACPRIVWRDGVGDESYQACASVEWYDVMFCDDNASG